MERIQGFQKYVRPRDIGPIISGFVAARALQDGKPLKAWNRYAFRSIERLATNRFTPEHLDPSVRKDLQQMYELTPYWHGTGRYQWEKGKLVDVLQTILAQGAITPHLDKYDPRLGNEAVKTISLAKCRLYARCYADIHHVSPDNLNRYIDAAHAASYFVVRSYLRHRYKQATSHPNGFWAGRRAQLEADQARFEHVGRRWSEKVRENPVNPMLTFRAGSDIPDNYGILFGIDSEVAISAAHTAFTETREVRSDNPISLAHITHVEVPANKQQEVQELLGNFALHVPVIAIEQMETYVSQLPIKEILGITQESLANE